MRVRDDRLQVSAIGVSVADRVLLKALINLTAGSGNRRWSFVENGQSAVVVVDTDTSEGRNFLENHSGNMLITLGSGPRPSDIHPHLSQPIRNQDLRAILARIDALLGNDAEQSTLPPEAFAAPSPPHPTTSAASASGERDQRRAAADAPQATSARKSPRPTGSDMLEKLRASLNDKGASPSRPPAAPAARVTGAAWHPVLLRLEHNSSRSRLHIGLPPNLSLAVEPDTDQGYLHGTIDSLDPSSPPSSTNFSLERISARRLTELKRGASTYPMDNLRWLLAIRLSGGILLTNPAQWSEYRLNRWPDFGRLPFRRQYARLSRMLLSRPATLAQLTLHADLSKAEVIAFLNAAYLCGWLVPASANSGPSIIAPTRRSTRPGLLARLRKSLGI